MRRLGHYIKALPPHARCLRFDPDGPAWDVQTELLAQTVEELSRLTRENPLQITRPWQEVGAQAPTRPTRGKANNAAPPPSQTQGIHKTPSGGVVANGMFAMIQHAAGTGHTVGSGNGE